MGDRFYSSIFPVFSISIRESATMNRNILSIFIVSNDDFNLELFRILLGQFFSVSYRVRLIICQLKSVGTIKNRNKLNDLILYSMSTNDGRTPYLFTK